MEKLENRNNYTAMAAAGTILVLIFAVGMFLVINHLMPFKQMEPPSTFENNSPPTFPRARGSGNATFESDSIRTIFLVHTLLSAAMLLLSIYLLFIYLRDYLQLKSKFTLGLVFAVFSFMLFAITANPLLMVFLGVYGGRGPFTIIPYVFATIALGILVYVSSK